MTVDPKNRSLKYVRFENQSKVNYGLLDGDVINEIYGDIFGTHEATGVQHSLGEVKLLYPCEPTKILAVGVNYRSHLEGIEPPSKPEVFFKPVSSLQNPGGPIVVPSDSTNIHSEGELVIVIGTQAKNISIAEARRVIFGVTCGNDVSEREWQGGERKDLQWWRAKGADTFAPLGPSIVTNVNYSRLLLQTRLNGDVVQEQYTSDLLFDCPTIVSFISKYVTLQPGDIIFTGTPGQTKKMKLGDEIEVAIENIGALRNYVKAAEHAIK